jgi:hypothetical protein
MNAPLGKTAAISWQNVLCRFFLIVFLGGVAFFGLFCLDDFLFVKLDASVRDSVGWWAGWVVLSFPFIIGLAGAAFLRGISIWKQVPLSITAALLASVFGVALQLAMGIQFHVAIGGTL